MTIRSRDGLLVDENWLCRCAVGLLERAMQEDPLDHAACKGYLDLVARILLPRVSTRREEQVDLDELRRSVMEHEQQQEEA